jgi:hypothetical protein
MAAILYMRLRRRFVNAVIAAILVFSLAGCGCTIFSNSTGCNAVVGATAIVAAPAIAVSRISEAAHDKSAQNAQRNLILAGDPQAIGNCIFFCMDYSELRDRSDLVDRSVDYAITTWGASPAADQLPVLMVAHAIKARNVSDADPVQAELHWRRVAEISTDARITSAIESKQYGAYGHNASYYSDIAIEAQRSLMVMYYKGLPGRTPDHSIFEGACKPVAAWPPAWMSMAGEDTHSLNRACDMGYYIVFGKFSSKY